MNKRTVCLTPECSKLWAIRPGLCFLYDAIIIDLRDYNEIIEQSDQSTYNGLLARNVERLRMEGILTIVDFSLHLPVGTRKSIHEAAKTYVNGLNDEKQIDLTISSHKEYLIYLQAQSLFCRVEEGKYAQLVRRMTRVKQRLDSIMHEPSMTDELRDTLVRITAKSLAGTHIVANFKDAHLYDTSEYRPFIKGLRIKGTPLLTRYHDSAEDAAMDIVAAVLLNKKLPDITVYDNHRMTEFLRARDDFSRLRVVLENVVGRYRDLIAVDAEAAYRHLHKEFEHACQALDNELDAARRRWSFQWKVVEILASIKSSLLNPFLAPLAALNEKRHRQIAQQELTRKDAFMGELVFLFDQVRFGRKRLADYVPRVPTPKKEPGSSVLWGEEQPLPWYERE